MRYLSAQEAAKLSGFAYKTILDLCLKRKMPCRQPTGKHGKWRIPEQEFKDWLEERGISPAPTKKTKKIARLTPEELW